MKKTRCEQKKPVEFKFHADPGKNIVVAGDFNNWNPTKMKLIDNGDGIYTITVQLTPGCHQYKFLVDGSWQIDFANPEMVQNDFGSMNSVIML